MPSATLTLSPAELDYLHTSLSAPPPTRPDLRTATAFRPLSAETGVLPSVNGSSHVHSADGGEVVVGVKLEVERTKPSAIFMTSQDASAVSSAGRGEDVMDLDQPAISHQGKVTQRNGKSDWVSLSLTLPGVRDDDPATTVLEEALGEGLTAAIRPSLPSQTQSQSPTRSAKSLSLQNLLQINSRFHWRVYIDAVLISGGSSSTAWNAASAPSGGGSNQADYSSLPLISFAIYLALRDTRVPQLKSTGEEDPMFEDDWERATWLYAREGQGNKEKHPAETGSEAQYTLRPPLTLLLCAIEPHHPIPDSHLTSPATKPTGTQDPTRTMRPKTKPATILLDPTRPELAVADCIVALSLGILSSPFSTSAAQQPPPPHHRTPPQPQDTLRFSITSLRTLDPPARDTFPGSADAAGGPSTHAQNATVATDEVPPAGVWRPKAGGVRPGLFGECVRAVTGSGETGTGAAAGGDDDGDGDGGGGGLSVSVAEDIVRGLDRFLGDESERERVARGRRAE